MIPAFRVLARMRGLRGTALDVFSLSAERRMERALIGEFEDTIEQLLAALAPEMIADATAIAAAYMDIRGYGLVKEQAAAEVRDRVARGLGALLNPVSKAA